MITYMVLIYWLPTTRDSRNVRDSGENEGGDLNELEQSLLSTQQFSVSYLQLTVKIAPLVMYDRIVGSSSTNSERCGETDGDMGEAGLYSQWIHLHLPPRPL
jgi:hypothetical protein